MPLKDMYRLHGRTCLVTGATGGIGLETARSLARFGATVLIVARDPARGAAAATAIGTAAAVPHSVKLFVADLSSQRDLRALARQVQQKHERLDVIVHNAGAVNRVRRVTVDGIEATLAVNHLAPFLLTELLAPALQAAPGSRVVVVSSYLHHWVKRIPWDDVESEHAYSGAATYNLTKLMNILYSYELARRWSGTGITANALHPGWPLKTNLGRDQTGPARLFDKVTKLFGASAAEGSTTSVYLAASPDVAGVTGKYFAARKVASSSDLSHDIGASQRLWNVSAALCGLSPL